MSKFVVILPSPNATVWNKIRKNWKSHYILDDRVAFVSDDERLTGEVATHAGIAPETSGIVIQMDYYSGRSAASLVEWLDKNS